MLKLVKSVTALVAITLTGAGLTACTASDLRHVSEIASSFSNSVDATEPGVPQSPVAPSNAPTLAEENDELNMLTIAPAQDGSTYLRTEQFGTAWLDVDNNGCDTRNDILNRDLTNITYKYLDDTCTVQTGTLLDPYTGKTIQFDRGPQSAIIQIDHIAALKYVWIHGAQTWTQEKREALANDPINLIAADGPTNSAKGSKGPENWMPIDDTFDCKYATLFINVATKYAISVTSADKRALSAALETCAVRR